MMMIINHMQSLHLHGFEQEPGGNFELPGDGYQQIRLEYVNTEAKLKLHTAMHMQAIEKAETALAKMESVPDNMKLWVEWKQYAMKHGESWLKT